MVKRHDLGFGVLRKLKPAYKSSNQGAFKNSAKERSADLSLPLALPPLVKGQGAYNGAVFRVHWSCLRSESSRHTARWL